MLTRGDLTLYPIADAEIVHFYDGRDRITSRGNRVTADIGGQLHHVRLPLSLAKQAIATTRLARRALRLDKCNVVMTNDQSGLMIAYQGGIYRYDLLRCSLTPTYRLRQCRNMLHQAILAYGERSFYFGEYGSNPTRDAVDVVVSHDGAATWQRIYRFAPGRIRHVHGVYHDPYTRQLWIPTGDFSNECFMIVADPDFERVRTIGSGDQRWRAVSVMFREDRVVWLMDSQLERSRAVYYDRESGEITVGREFPGPVWYVKELADGVTLAATAFERGDGVTTDSAHVFASRDLIDWREVMRVPHDGLPLGWFKFGVIGFADGRQTSDDFVLFGEALRGMDGRAFRCRLETADLTTESRSRSSDLDAWLRGVGLAFARGGPASQPDLPFDTARIPELARPMPGWDETGFRTIFAGSFRTAVDPRVRAWQERLQRVIGLCRQDLIGAARARTRHAASSASALLARWAAVLAVAARREHDAVVLNALLTVLDASQTRRRHAVLSELDRALLGFAAAAADHELQQLDR